ncbi:SDR family NAD(P)-dependent oxidoreductase [Halomonas elongata]|uniref:SDR family NAD(P)-dependent oxidoreductase n=1 Tax=Halomonas elongata TaxID=2746 RepID=UPI0038D3EA39
MLSSKKAVITGGSDGIGLGIAKEFARNGANLLLVSRNEEKLMEVAGILSSSYNAEVKTFSADLSSSEEVRKTAQNILGIWSEVDILVNNAGAGSFTPFTETVETDLDRHLNLNVKAPYILTQCLLDAIEARKGTIINISSYFAHRMLPGRPSTAYSLTKGAINAFTKSLAYELGSKGIRVNAIAPGTVNSPLVRSNFEKLTDDGKTRFSEMIKTIYPLGRIGEPGDISGAAVFLASEQARWVTGSILAVDGGLTTN